MAVSSILIIMQASGDGKQGNELEGKVYVAGPMGP
jgi:hypothetical protein